MLAVPFVQYVVSRSVHRAVDHRLQTIEGLLDPVGIEAGFGWRRTGRRGSNPRPRA